MYESRTELTYVLQNSQRFSGRVCCTELTDLIGYRYDAVQNSKHLSGTGNTRVNTPGIKKVKTIFLRLRIRFVGYKRLTGRIEL